MSWLLVPNKNAPPQTVPNAQALGVSTSSVASIKSPLTASESVNSSSSDVKTTTLEPVSLMVAQAATAASAKTSRTRGTRNANDGTVFNNIGMPQAVKVKPQNNVVHKFVQSYTISAGAVSSNTVSTFSANYFSVASLDQLSSLTGVFDQYRIDLVEVWLIPRTAGSTGVNTQNFGFFASVLDFDDAASLGTFGQALDYENAVVSSGNDGHYRAFKPHTATAAYSGTFTSYMNVESPWLDAASPTVQHYGLKTAWTTTDSVYTMDFWVRLHTSWRNIR